MYIYIYIYRIKKIFSVKFFCPLSLVSGTDCSWFYLSGVQLNCIDTLGQMLALPISLKLSIVSLSFSFCILNSDGLGLGDTV